MRSPRRRAHGGVDSRRAQLPDRMVSGNRDGVGLWVLALCCSASFGDLRIASDQSLSPEQYMELGFPDFQRDWSADERSKARSLLRQLAEESPTQLPRYESQSSGAVFAKLIHEEFQRRGDFEGALWEVPVGKPEQHDPEELTRLVQSDSLEGIYGPSLTGGLLFDRELVELAARELTKALKVRSNLASNLAQLEADPGPSTHRRDLAARSREVLESIDGVFVQRFSQLAAFAVAERFTPAARGDATAHLADQIPLIAPLLSAEARANLRE